MAGVAINLCLSCFSVLIFVCLVVHTKHRKTTRDRDICVTVGLSSEVCLLPNRNKVCDF